MLNSTEHLRRLQKAIGSAATANIVIRRMLGVASPVRVQSGDNNIVVRPCDSDLFVAGQVFGAREYEVGLYKTGLTKLAMSWAAEGVTPIILDIGANVGYSALYFAQEFPGATVVAVEADKTTFDILSQNVAGHSQIHPVHAAVWSHEDGVDLAPPSPFGSWAGRVEESSGGLTPSRLLSSTFAHIPNARPLIVKLDVEGAEREICSTAKDVLAEAPCILIEPHDFMLPGHGCLQHLFRALADRELDTLIIGENLMFIQSDLSAAPPHIS